MLIIGGTGLFMRPPLLAFILGDFPALFYPGKLSENPLEEKIHNALYDEITDKIILETSDGFYKISSNFSEKLEKIVFEVPVFVMGATVFELTKSGDFLVGSFSGLFLKKRNSGEVFDFLTGKKAEKVSSVRPGKTMITGFFESSKGEKFIFSHDKGLISLEETTLNSFKMPKKIQKNYKISLWNYLFEIHNARFFREWVGGFYILIIPLGSMLFLLISLSGIFDYFYRRQRTKKQEDETLEKAHEILKHKSKKYVEKGQK
jgi:hypothetical protein